MDIGSHQSASNSAAKASTVTLGVSWHAPPQSLTWKMCGGGVRSKTALPRDNGAAVVKNYLRTPDA